MVQRRFYAKLKYGYMANMELGLGVCIFSCQCSAVQWTTQVKWAGKETSADVTLRFNPGLRARDVKIWSFGHFMAFLLIFFH